MGQQIALSGVTDAITPDMLAGISGVLLTLGDNADDLLVQAQGAVIDSDETLARAGDLAKIIRAQENYAESERTKLTGPINGLVKKINNLFKVSAGTRKQALDAIKVKADAWQEQRRKAAEEAAKLARQKAEEEALRAAEAMQEAGDSASAEVLLEMGAQEAVKIEQNAKPELVRGDYGSSVGSRREVTGKVGNPKMFLIELAAMPNWADFVDFKQAGLNRLAQSIDKGNHEPVGGFNVVVANKTNFR